MKPVSVVTVTAPNDKDGNSRKAYILIKWCEKTDSTYTEVIRDQYEGIHVLDSHMSVSPYDLPNVSVRISAREFKRLFKEGGC